MNEIYYVLIFKLLPSEIVEVTEIIFSSKFYIVSIENHF